MGVYALSQGGSGAAGHEGRARRLAQEATSRWAESGSSNSERCLPGDQKEVGSGCRTHTQTSLRPGVKQVCLSFITVHVYVCVYVCVHVCACTHSVTSNSWWPHGLQPARLLSQWDSPGKNTGVGCHFLLQGIFSTQGLNPGLSHWQTDSSSLSHQGSQSLL